MKRLLLKEIRVHAHRVCMAVCIALRTTPHRCMNAFKLPHELSEALEQRREQIFAAILVDSLGHTLLAGRALLEGNPAVGTFWPDQRRPKDISPNTVGGVRRSDGTTIAVRQFRACTASHGHLHYHFNT